ncbi:MAG: AAA family ATPase [Thermomicrobiales bacterium]
MSVARDGPDVWLVSGIPGSGKTTTARRLAERLPAAAHVEADRLGEWVVSGGVPPGGEPPEEADRQLALCRALRCRFADGYCRAGFVTVIDFVIDFVIVSRAQLGEYQVALPGWRVGPLVLAPDPAVVLARDAARIVKRVARQWVHLDAVLRGELAEMGPRIDNASLSPDETVDRILAGRDRALIMPAARPAE